jgi:hypothetical protein
MQPLILHPTDTSQWYSLIMEAQVQSKINLPVDTESYLVFLLMRSSKTTDWLDSIIGVDLIHALEKKGRQQKQLLLEVGDKSLLLSGFFPELVAKRKLDPMYFVHIGQIAYASVGAYPDEPAQKLYCTLSDQFLTLQSLLKTAKNICILTR